MTQCKAAKSEIPAVGGDIRGDCDVFYPFVMPRNAMSKEIAEGFEKSCTARNTIGMNKRRIPTARAIGNDDVQI